MAPQEEEEEDARFVLLYIHHSLLDAQDVGYARRYFYLRANGTLSYSLQPGQTIRDQLPLHNAALSSSPSNRYIHVDTERGTFHMRGMTQAAYESWMTALRLVVSILPIDLPSHRLHRRFIMMPRAFADSEGTLRRSFNYNARTLSFSVGHAAKMNTVLSEMSEVRPLFGFLGLPPSLKPKQDNRDS